MILQIKSFFKRITYYKKIFDSVKNEFWGAYGRGKNYRTWESEGLVSGVKGNDIVAKYIREIYDTYGIRPYRCGYNRWHAKEFAKIVARDLIENSPCKSGELSIIPSIKKTSVSGNYEKYVRYMLIEARNSFGRSVQEQLNLQHLAVLLNLCLEITRVLPKQPNRGIFFRIRFFDTNG